MVFLMTHAQLSLKIEGLRPDVADLPEMLQHLIAECVHDDPKLRPDFIEIEKRLERMRRIDSDSRSV